MLNKPEPKISREEIFNDLSEFWNDTSNDKISAYFTKEEIIQLNNKAREQNL